MPRTGLFLSHQTMLVAALLLSAPAFAQPRPGTKSTAAVTTRPVAAASSAPAADDCFPTCRAGYVCVRGQCVSSCNPPCAANESCNTTGQCVANAPAPAAASGTAATGPGQTQGAQPALAPPPETGEQSSPQSMVLGAPEPPPTQPSPAEIKTFSFVPRIGLQLGGSATEKATCEGPSCNPAGSASVDFDLKSAFAIGADFMFKVHNLIRIGPGLLHTLASDGSAGGTTAEVGSITELNFVAEAIPRVSRIVWLVPRAQLGATMFTASGPYKNDIATWKGMCTADKSTYSSQGASTTCSNFDNPHLGFNLGIGFGALFAVSPSIRLRADALIEYFKVTLGKEEVSGGGYDFKWTNTLASSRFLLLLGAEI